MRKLAAAAALLAPASAAAAATGARWRRVESGAVPSLDLRDPGVQLATFMKLQTRLDAGAVFYWYRCRLDYAVSGQPIVNVCGYDSLYRFDVVAPAPGALLNPFHFTEGPVEFRHAPKRRDGSDFSMPWTVVGDDVWVANDTYWDFPHPLPPHEWPRASSGERLQFSNSSTLRGSVRELADARVRSATCRLSYQATSGWLPWMQRGSAPGHVIWRGQGVKLGSLDEVPESSRAAFQRIHPEMFRSTPWSGKRVMFEEYTRARRPETG